MEKSGIVRRWVASLLLAATLLGVWHHHGDFKPHHECPVCVLQNNLAGADLPAEPSAPALLPAFFPDFPLPLHQPKAENVTLPPVRAPPKHSTHTII